MCTKVVQNHETKEDFLIARHPVRVTLAFASILSVVTQHLKAIVQDAVRHSSLLALLAKFRYALCLQRTPHFNFRFNFHFISPLY